MNDPWTPYGGAPRGVDPVGAVPGVSGWILVLVGISIVTMGVIQISAVVEGVTRMGLRPTDASLVGLVTSFLPLIGAAVATYGATQSDLHSVPVALCVYFWPYLIFLVAWLFGVLHAKSSSDSDEIIDPDD